MQRKTNRPQNRPKTSSTREQIIVLLQDNPRYTKQDLMNVLNKASGTIKEHIRILQQEGKLNRVGSSKDGHWEVVPKE
ncbi:MAG: winged helix-turn-helix transcriptional regulator [Kiritimatiellae bacterium]|nr:winged helix-turn-helix transcriptional regulator [Kiritimatiellia bacterium]